MEKVLLIEAVKGGLAPIQVLDFDHEGDRLRFFYRHIGCDCIDIVCAYGLKEYGLEGVSLVVDDEGLFKNEPVPNAIGSFLYGYLEHGQPLVGNVLVVKDIETNSGIESGGFDGEELRKLYAAINDLVRKHNERVSRS